MSVELTSSSQSGVCSFGIGDFKAPQQQLEPPLRQPLLPPIEGLQPLDILHIQVVLYKSLVKEPNTACALSVVMAQSGWKSGYHAL